MTNEELYMVRLRDEFYRDGFYRVLIAVGSMIIAIGLLIAVSVYLFLAKPRPVVFSTYADWRILAPVPVEDPYLKTPDLIQWVSDALPAVFTCDFIHYTEQQTSNMQYFTAGGSKKYLDVMNVYANADTVKKSKWFVSAVASGAPFVLNQGLLQGRYGWWIQMPLTMSYSNYEKETSQPIVVQALVVRVPTLNNLYGVSIDNIIVTKGEGNQVQTNG